MAHVAMWLVCKLVQQQLSPQVSVLVDYMLELGICLCLAGV